jgi:predicted nucleotidyltransferase
LKVLGIIVEYNPLHDGHLYHLTSSIELVKPDFVVAVMSGNFVQRGEPSIVDKFARTKMALNAGIDVVFELPTIYSIQDARGFAIGSVGILNATNVVTDLVFGSESNDLKIIEKIASLIVEESPAFERTLKEHLGNGLSFPNARRLAISSLLNYDAEQMRYSNDILGIEYVAELKRLRSKIEAHTIKRIGASYNEEELLEIPSATSLRKAISEKRKLEGIPYFTEQILEEEFKNGRGPVFLNSFYDLMRSKIILLGRERLEQLYGFNEGISQRFLMNSCASQNIEEFLNKTKTKRFTFTRIKRRLFYTIFEIDKTFVLESNEFGPQYLRLLGFTERGKSLLRHISDRSSLPLISNLSDFKNSIQSREINVDLARMQIALDIKASDIYAMNFKSSSERLCKRDFRKPIIHEQ